MGGGDQDSTTTANSEYPAEFKPLASNAVGQIIGAQNLRPLTSFTPWMPGGVAGVAPAHAFEMDELLPASLRPTAGLEGLLGLAGPVHQLQAGALGASGPTGAEDAALSYLIGSGARGAAAPDLSGFLGSLPPLPRLGPSIFPGVTEEDIEGLDDMSSREVPILGGTGPDSLNPSEPGADMPSPIQLPHAPDLTSPDALSSLLPPDARGAFQSLINQGVSPSDAFSQAMASYFSGQLEASEAAEDAEDAEEAASTGPNALPPGGA